MCVVCMCVCVVHASADFCCGSARKLLFAYCARAPQCVCLRTHVCRLHFTRIGKSTSCRDCEMVLSSRITCPMFTHFIYNIIRKICFGLTGRTNKPTSSQLAAQNVHSIFHQHKSRYDGLACVCVCCVCAMFVCRTHTHTRSTRRQTRIINAFCALQRVACNSTQSVRVCPDCAATMCVCERRCWYDGNYSTGHITTATAYTLTSLCAFVHMCVSQERGLLRGFDVGVGGLVLGVCVGACQTNAHTYTYSNERRRCGGLFLTHSVGLSLSL